MSVQLSVKILKEQHENLMASAGKYSRAIERYEAEIEEAKIAREETLKGAEDIQAALSALEAVAE